MLFFSLSFISYFSSLLYHISPVVSFFFFFIPRLSISLCLLILFSFSFHLFLIPLQNLHLFIILLPSIFHILLLFCQTSSHLSFRHLRSNCRHVSHSLFLSFIFIRLDKPFIRVYWCSLFLFKADTIVTFSPQSFSLLHCQLIPRIVTWQFIISDKVLISFHLCSFILFTLFFKLHKLILKGHFIVKGIFAEVIFLP